MSSAVWTTPYLSNCCRIALLSVALSIAAGAVQTQPADPRALQDYVGTYVDAPGHTLEIVAADRVFAVIDEAKYRLTWPAGEDHSSEIAAAYAGAF